MNQSITGREVYYGYNIFPNIDTKLKNQELHGNK